MSTRLAKISIYRDGCEQALGEVADLVREVVRLLRRHADASDVTISVELPQGHGTLLVALQAGSAFIGLDTHDGIYQYVADDAATAERQFLIGGQPTAIDARYVLPVAEVVDVLTGWLGGSARLGESAWERQ
jgi:hypothetical protein